MSTLLIATTVSAQVQGLERVGPVSPSNGYPTWYQDKTGLTLEFCQPLNQGELDGGWCLLLPADTTVPETFPAPFADEHFFFAADASTTGAIPAILVIGLEGAFAVGPPIDGDQIVFARIRFKFTAPAAGTYTIRHPFGTDTVDAAAGELVFVTEDIGLTCPTGFDCALRGRIGPFLLPSATPGGAEIAAVAGPMPGKLYIADPARLGPVTGSPVGQNFFRVEGPGGIFSETFDFALMGRIYQGTMPGRMTVDRARFARTTGSVQGKTDVFATAFATAQPRLPGALITGLVTPILGFYPAACSAGAGGVLSAPAGVSAVQMFGTDTRYYGQTEGAIPAAVCVQDYTARDTTGQAIPSFAQKAVSDQVTITQALYDPASGGSLTVLASSSDQNLLPALTASMGGALTNQPDGTASVVAPNVGVPPVKITVTSAAGGRAELEVSTMVGQPALPDVPLAGNDAFTLNEDSGTLSMNVIANDTFGGIVITSGTIAITTPPGLGTAAVNTTTGAIDFTPAANANGNDLLIYTVTVGGQTSPPAFVSIIINPVNDAPVAVDDAASGVGELGFSINLLANDTDVDGAADLVGANILTSPAGLTYTLVGGTLSFTAPAGSYVFTYQARDAAGLLSNTATATVTLTAGDTLTITRAEFIRNKLRWRITGTASNPTGQTVYVMYDSGTFTSGATAVGTLVGTTTVDALGAWVIDFALAGANDPRNPTSALFSAPPRTINATSTLGGSSPPTAFTVK